MENKQEFTITQNVARMANQMSEAMLKIKLDDYTPILEYDLAVMVSAAAIVMGDIYTSSIDAGMMNPKESAIRLAKSMLDSAIQDIEKYDFFEVCDNMSKQFDEQEDADKLVEQCKKILSNQK